MALPILTGLSGLSTLVKIAGVFASQGLTTVGLDHQPQQVFLHLHSEAEQDQWFKFH